MIAKLFRDENENSREKVKLLKKDISEKEQRIVDLKFIVRVALCFQLSFCVFWIWTFSNVFPKCPCQLDGLAL